MWPSGELTKIACGQPAQQTTKGLALVRPSGEAVELVTTSKRKKLRVAIRRSKTREAIRRDNNIRKTRRKNKINNKQARDREKVIDQVKDSINRKAQRERGAEEYMR